VHRVPSGTRRAGGLVRSDDACRYRAEQLMRHRRSRGRGSSRPRPAHLRMHRAREERPEAEANAGVAIGRRVGSLMRASPRVERCGDEGNGNAGLPVGTVPADLWRTPAGSVLQYVRDPDPGANRRGVEKARGRNMIDRLAAIDRRASAREWTGQGMSAEGRMKAPC